MDGIRSRLALCLVFRNRPGYPPFLCFFPKSNLPTILIEFLDVCSFAGWEWAEAALSVWVWPWLTKTLEVVCAELMKSKGLCRAIRISTHGIMASEHHLSGYFLWLLFWRVSLGLRTGGACEWGVGRWEGRGFSVNTLVYTSHRPTRQHA